MWCQLLGPSVLCRNPRFFLSFTSSIAHCLSLIMCLAGFSAPYTFHYRFSGCHRSHSEYLGEATGGSSFRLLTRYPVFHLEFVLLRVISQELPLEVSYNYELHDELIFFSRTSSVTLLCHAMIIRSFFIAFTTEIVSDCVCFLKCSEKLLFLPCGCQTRFTKHADSFYQMIENIAQQRQILAAVPPHPWCLV